jgi:tetratricopeptide (TPR) repeat protein
MLKQILFIITGSLTIARANAQLPKDASLLYNNYDSAYVQMGDLSIKQNKFDSAILYYTKALQINPRQVLAYIGMGNIYKNVKDEYDKAISNYSAALKIDSTNKETYYNIAWCYNAKTDYDNAIIYALKALDIDNNYRAAYGELGHAYHLSKKYADAIEQFKKYIALSGNPLPMLYSGLCYIELKDKDGAMKMYEELKKTDSKMAESLKRNIDKANL